MLFAESGHAIGHPDQAVWTLRWKLWKDHDNDKLLLPFHHIADSVNPKIGAVQLNTWTRQPDSITSKSVAGVLLDRSNRASPFCSQSALTLVILARASSSETALMEFLWLQQLCRHKCDKIDGTEYKVQLRGQVFEDWFADDVAIRIPNIGEHSHCTVWNNLHEVLRRSPQHCDGHVSRFDPCSKHLIAVSR